MRTERHPKQDGVLRILNRVYVLLRPGERRTSVLMLATVALNCVVEVLGLVVVIPVIGLAVQPDLIHRNYFLGRVYRQAQVFGEVTERDLLMVLSIGLVFVFAFKALVGLLLTLFQTRFSFSVAHRLSGLMWAFHFSQNLEKLRETDSGRVLAEINDWPQVFANTYMVGALRLITEILVMMVICVGLLAYAPVVLITVAILLGSGTLVVRGLTNTRLRAYGDVRKARAPQTNSMVTNAIRGILEVITFRAEEPLKQEYLNTTKLLFRISSNSSVLRTVPAKTYEVLAVLGVSGAIVISILQGTGDEEYFELLSLMTLSAYRIMPTMSRVNGAIMGMRQDLYALEAVEKGHEGLRSHGASVSWKPLSLDHAPSIELRSITARYEVTPNPVLEDLTHRFDARKIHAVIGPSGSGKSTLVNVMLGIHPLESGRVVIDDGEKSWTLGETCSRESWLEEVGYLSQHPFFFSGSVEDNLTFRAPGRSVDVSHVMELVNRLGLKDCLGEDPLSFHLNEAGSNLSGGQQQRLALLRSLQIDTKVLLLDEATSALDVDSRDRVFQLLRERADRGTLVLIITHDRELAAMCDEVLELES